MSRFLGLLLLIPLLAACGGSASSPSASTTLASPGTSGGATLPPLGSEAPSDQPGASATAAATTGPVQQLACEATGPGWAVTALAKPDTAETGTTPAAKALSTYVTGPDGADLPDTGWRELYRSKDTALYGQADPSGEPGVLLVATIRATNGAWSGEDSGQCRPRTWLGTSLGIAADWKLAAKTTKTSKTIKVLVTESACASGQSAKGRIAAPRITYDTDKVTITIGVKPLPGSQNCPSNPATAYTVTLTEALGDRQLLNGGPYPAVAVAQPK